MVDTKQAQASQDIGRVLEVVVRLGLVALLVVWVFQIVAPFVSVVTWAAIIAITLYPSFLQLTQKLGGRAHLAAVLFASVSVGSVVFATVALVDGSMNETLELVAMLRDGSLSVPPPMDEVREIPVIGDTLYETWSDAYRDVQATIIKFAEPLKALGNRAFHAVLGVGSATAMSVFALVVASVFMAHGKMMAAFALRLGARVLGLRGADIIHLATGTIRSVALGVLGVAFIQAALAGLGFAVMDIPLAGLWSICVLFFAIAQLPTLLVLAPVAFYSFSVHEATEATLFSVYLFVVAVSDNIIKPILLGRSAQVPTLVILIGSVGGMLFGGIIGLFTGSVVLAVFYRLFGAWLMSEPSLAQPSSDVSTSDSI